MPSVIVLKKRKVPIIKFNEFINSLNNVILEYGFKPINSDLELIYFLEKNIAPAQINKIIQTIQNFPERRKFVEKIFSTLNMKVST